MLLRNLADRALHAGPGLGDFSDLRQLWLSEVAR